MLRITTPLAALFLAAACSTTPDPDVPAAPVLELTDVSARSGDGPSGWIYAFDRASGEPDACVYVWSPSEWSLATETSPGHYATDRIDGTIRDGVALDFPVEVLNDARNLYVSGHIKASVGGRRIRSSR